MQHGILPFYECSSSVCLFVQVLEHSKGKDALIEKLVMANTQLTSASKTAYQQGNKDGQAGVTEVGSTCWQVGCARGKDLCRCAVPVSTTRAPPNLHTIGCFTSCALNAVWRWGEAGPNRLPWCWQGPVGTSPAHTTCTAGGHKKPRL